MILVAAVGLYHFVEGKGPGAKPPLDLTQFLAKGEAGESQDVEINASKVTGRLVAAPEIFTSTIPLEYPTVYDKLTTKGVKVTVIPPDPNPWLAMLLSWGLPMLFVFGFW